jgi:trimethylamine-N-oxide reductase (cytochrome c), cytochrome c-type subunit TorC
MIERPGDSVVDSSARSFSFSSAFFTLVALAVPVAADPPKLIADAAGAFADTTAAVYAIATLPVSSSPEGATVATLSPSTSAKVLAIEGKNLKLQISGWQQGSGGRWVFLAPGRRIPVAEVSAEQKDLLRRGATQTDATTGQEWTEVSFEAYAPKTQLVASIDLLWTYANDLMNANCTTCHARHPVDHFTANQWAGILRSKKERVAASADQLALMGQYAQKHASDMAK